MRFFNAHKNILQVNRYPQNPAHKPNIFESAYGGGRVFVEEWGKCTSNGKIYGENEGCFQFITLNGQLYDTKIKKNKRRFNDFFGSFTHRILPCYKAEM